MTLYISLCCLTCLSKSGELRKLLGWNFQTPELHSYCTSINSLSMNRKCHIIHLILSIKFEYKCHVLKYYLCNVMVNTKCYIVWLSLMRVTDWLNTLTWLQQNLVCSPHFFTQTNGKMSLRYYRFKNVCWPPLTARWLFIARTVQ